MERNITLDYLKLVLALLVLLAHCHNSLAEIPYLGWSISQGLSRVTMPIFFIINGFYLQPIIHDKAKVKRYLYNLLKLYLLWMVIYVPFQTIVAGTKTDPTVIRVLYWVFGWGHLWYMSALMGAVVLVYFAKRIGLGNKLLLGIGFLLFLSVYTYQHLFLFGFDIPTTSYMFTKTFLFTGFPYLFIGFYIRDEGVIDRFRITKTTYVLTGLLLLGVLGESVAFYVWKTHTDFYLLLPFVAPLIFILVFKKGRMGVSDGFVAQLSSAVYYSHLFFICMIERTTDFTQTNLFILSVFVTLIMSTALIVLNRHIKVFL
ncbi:MAG: hypothetical protein RL662_1741 [Bacteroidota bacterium]|jgi:hypothetical protein